MPASTPRRLAHGAEVASSGTHFRYWAPALRSLSVVLERGGDHSLTPEPEG